MLDVGYRNRPIYVPNDCCMIHPQELAILVYFLFTPSGKIIIIIEKSSLENIIGNFFFCHNDLKSLLLQMVQNASARGIGLNRCNTSLHVPESFKTF